MAIGKDVTTASGATASYFKISKYDNNRLSGLTRIELQGFLNKEACDNKCEPLKVSSYDFWDNVDPLFTKENTVDEMVTSFYEKISSLPEWEGAKIV